MSSRGRWLALLCASFPALGWSADNPETRNLGDLSIEELMNESITSVAKKEQRMAEAPAAVYVLTGEEIVRSGVSSLPEALRMIPGLSVAQLDTQSWVVASRGFASQYAGELLVLIDGRTVYDPFYSGVPWGRQDVLLENIDRIEVIRGPGAALWGANAVNGVINIITKDSAATQGGLAVGSWGQTESYGALQWGGQAGDAHYRAYLKYDDYAGADTARGTAAGAPWHMGQGGFRADWRPSGADSFTLQGDVYDGKQHASDPQTSLTPPYMSAEVESRAISGGNILGRWRHSDSERSRWSVQAYYDRAQRRDDILGVQRDTFDVEFQHQLEFGSRQTLVYGAGYRYTQASYQDSYFLSYAHSYDAGHLTNLFLQDEINLVPKRLELTLGSKFEDDYFTGIETQPSARLMWTPDASHSVWASVSRAVRTPTFAETGLRINRAAYGPAGPGLPPTVMSNLPNPDLQSQQELSYELGLRAQAGGSLFLDVATFFNSYRDLVVVESTGTTLEASPMPEHLAITSRYVNKMQGTTYGLELVPTWQVTEWWKLTAGYTWLHMNLHSDALQHAGEQKAGDSPQQQAQIRSSMQWRHRLSLDSALYYVDRLPNQNIASYTRLDASVGWMATDRLDLRVGGTNLLNPRHAEFRGSSTTPVQIERSVYGRVEWRF